MKVSKKLSILTSLVAISCGQGKDNKKAEAQEPQTETAAPTAEAPMASAVGQEATAGDQTAKSEPQQSVLAQEESKETSQEGSTGSEVKAEELVPAPNAPAAAEVVPGSVVVRVPVVDGKEDPNKVEVRIDTEKTDAKDAAIVDTFNKAKSTESIVKEDELDKSTSTQSWFFGRLFGGYNNYNNYYAPSYYYSYGGSYSYNYNYNQRPYNYNYGGYNYYYYPSYNYNSYSYGSSYGNNGNYGNNSYGGVY
jgi:hypothetical protein